jgi:hypothetical protein
MRHGAALAALILQRSTRHTVTAKLHSKGNSAGEYTVHNDYQDAKQGAKQLTAQAQGPS